ncbi:MAG: T9SS type A sorting domain-containing protein [Flavobacteriales bacterium]|nr:T9SS type A sorting domain-containing protein [Flavobacteriales bacterium]
MKNIKRTTLTCLLLWGIVFGVNAQNKKKKYKDGEMKVIVVNSVDGKVTRTEDTYSLKDKKAVEKMLKEKGIELNLDGENGMSVIVTGEGDMDKRVIIETISKDGNNFTIEEHVKVVTVKDGETIHGGDDVKVTVEEIDGGNGKKIKITSISDSFHDHEIIVEASGDELEEGKTMIFVRKNSEVSSTNLPKSINEVFDGNASVKDLDLFPNPTNGNFKMRFTSERADNFELSITDAKGARIYEKKLRKFKGEFNEEFDLSEYDAGIYFFNLTSKEQSLSKKIVVQ